jgi:hypothetical protein
VPTGIRQSSFTRRPGWHLEELEALFADVGFSSDLDKPLINKAIEDKYDDEF